MCDCVRLNVQNDSAIKSNLIIKAITDLLAPRCL